MLERMCILIIDMLNDFVTGSLKCERAQRIIPNLRRLVEAARKFSVPIIYCNDAHYPVDFEVVNRWGVHALKGSEGAEVIPELKPTEKDFIVEKRVYSSFYETGLDPLLRSLYNGEGVKTVVLCGLHTNICVRHTAADAFFRGYRIVVAKDGVEAFTQEDHEQGLRYLEYVYNAKLMSVDEIIEEMEKMKR
ncbi:MAG: isochorismatase family cysteine hydrolase [Candidatus Bathyarchaeia archaeon]